MNGCLLRARNIVPMCYNNSTEVTTLLAMYYPGNNLKFSLQGTIHISFNIVQSIILSTFLTSNLIFTKDVCIICGYYLHYADEVTVEKYPQKYTDRKYQSQNSYHGHSLYPLKSICFQINADWTISHLVYVHIFS